MRSRVKEAEAVCRVVEETSHSSRRRRSLVSSSTAPPYKSTRSFALISYLLTQKSRSEFLTLAYEIELHGHRDIYRLLTAISFSLQKQHRAFEQRMKMLQDPVVMGNRQERETIDSRDKFLSRLYTLLDDDEYDDHAPIFLTYAKLAENAGKLEQQLSSLRAQTASGRYRQQDMLTALVKELRECEEAVYAGSIASSGQPVLSPAPVVDAISQLGTMLLKLEQVSVDIIKVANEHKQAIKSDSVLATERELFTYFFTDPDRLRRTVADVEKRVQAQQVS
ncbi:hypothetical protein NP493_109g06005 [Ridgeia piscesae]|uniref:Uncharacterized protein n=1 Tax=Ridgeia piscesae TaxID=27915 RepID=A0AAD9P709_RIDPI|nr:hypothetical protein NP493_109g06005 [Ridgeia piscesae]